MSEYHILNLGAGGVRVMRAITPLLLLALCSPLPAEEENLPLVVDHVHEIIVAEVDNADYNSYDWVFFFQANGTVQAHRTFQDDMVFGREGDKFYVMWQDYYQCDRIVYCKKFSVVNVKENPLWTWNDGPWWAAWRNMRDLTEP